MDKSIVRAYLWQEVVRLAFHPTGKRDIAAWIHLYQKSLRDFWQMSHYPELPKVTPQQEIKGAFDYEQLGCCADYTVVSRDKFSASILHSASAQGLLWSHHVDPGYFYFPIQDFLTAYGGLAKAISAFGDDDLAAVLNGLLFHPAAHQHIVSPIDKHHIRIGGGISNAFAYLFHLRYQLCPIENLRKAEQSRLLHLFKPAIQSNMTISAQDLMKVPHA